MRLPHRKDALGVERGAVGCIALGGPELRRRWIPSIVDDSGVRRDRSKRDTHTIAPPSGRFVSASCVVIG